MEFLLEAEGLGLAKLGTVAEAGQGGGEDGAERRARKRPVRAGSSPDLTNWSNSYRVATQELILRSAGAPRRADTGQKAYKSSLIH